MPQSRDFRVISGLFKGQRLKFPSDTKTHPMGNREKLALFNMVNTEDARVLDIFAGSGALGVEALSRGAKEVVFVEKSPSAARIIKENLAELKALNGEILTAKTTIFTESAEHFCSMSDFQGYFDLVLADPPYDGFTKFDRPSRASSEAAHAFRPENGLYPELARLAALLRPSGRLVVSSPASLPPLTLDGLETLKSHTYAGARLTIYAPAIDKI